MAYCTTVAFHWDFNKLICVERWPANPTPPFCIYWVLDLGKMAPSPNSVAHARVCSWTGWAQIQTAGSKRMLLLDQETQRKSYLFHCRIDGPNSEGRWVRAVDSQMQTDKFRLILCFTESLGIIHLISLLEFLLLRDGWIAQKEPRGAEGLQPSVYSLLWLCAGLISMIKIWSLHFSISLDFCWITVFHITLFF